MSRERVHKPFCFEADKTAAVCPTHGQMDDQHLILRHGGRLWTTTDEMAFYSCSACLSSLTDGVSLSPKSVIRLLLAEHFDEVRVALRPLPGSFEVFPADASSAQDDRETETDEGDEE